jgi:hypothetical protein
LPPRWRAAQGVRPLRLLWFSRPTVTWTAIMAEVQANNQKVQQLASDKGLKTTQNVAAGVAGRRPRPLAKK